MQRDFAFVETAPGELLVGWGPFEPLPFRRPGQPAFFITDFFLDDPNPWRHPETWERLTLSELAARFERQRPVTVEWQPLTIRDFAPLFESACDAFARSEFDKVVPIVFENGHVPGGGARILRDLLERLAAVPPAMRAYGFAAKGEGMIGATPEVLFESDGRGYRTMALAGTRASHAAAELLHDSKEQREHRVVVEDIVRRLAPFGHVEIEPCALLELPGIAHLLTPIRFQELGTERLSFVDLVRRLHPTAALGVSPRTAAGQRWLRNADRGVERRTFGAPFGLERDDGTAIALVAIRNLQWSGDSLRVGAGAGVLADSQLEREFEELRQKRDQVKSLFGLESGSAASVFANGTALESSHSK